MKFRSRMRAFITWAVIAAIVLPALAVPVLSAFEKKPQADYYVATYGVMTVHLPVILK